MTSAHHQQIWTSERVETLKREYSKAREDGQVRDLAERLGVQLYEVYRKAHRLGLARGIRNR